MMETFKGSQIHGVAGILLTLALAYKLDEARQRNVLRSLDPEECYPILLLFFLPLHGKPFLEILKTALGVFYSEVVNEALPGSSKSLTKPGEEESSGTISQATFLYNYRARYFDPSQGRFLQTDPLGYQDSMNLYQGMNMNPVNFVDPWGEIRRTKHGGVNYLADYMNEVEYSSETPWYNKLWYVAADTAGNTVSDMLSLDIIADSSIIMFDSSYSAKERVKAGAVGATVSVFDVIGGEIVGKVVSKLLLSKPVQWIANKAIGSRWGRKTIDFLTHDAVRVFKKEIVKGDTFYRYVGEKEAEYIRRNGVVPNVNAEGESKLIYFTNRKYETAGRAKTYNQLPRKPKYGVVIDSSNVPNRTPFSRINPDANPQWGLGGGVEATTPNPIPVDALLIFILKGGR